ncbi:MAG: sensor histidine kinase [Actinomycetes bacterium]
MRSLLPAERYRPSRLDVAIAGFFAGLVLLEAATSASVPDPVRHASLGVPAMAALAWRRHFPLLVAAVVLVVNPVANPGGEFSISLSFGLLAYTVGRECGAPRAQLGLALMVGWFVTALVVENGGVVPSDVAAAGVLIGGTWTVGQFVRQRAQMAHDAHEHADRLLHEQELRAAAAVTEERVRLARELHDVVSHSISVVAVQAQAVRRRLPSELQREIDDLTTVETTAREVMAELRRLFGVLRTDGEVTPLAPQPGLAELDRLAESVRATGLRVTVTRTGSDTPLPPGVDLAAYRIIQEAVTNAIRHAGASLVSVQVDRTPGAVEILVEDDGRGIAVPQGAQGPQGARGHGLLGIRERAELYGGSLVVGTAPSGGVKVAARLPVGPG